MYQPKTYTPAEAQILERQWAERAARAQAGEAALSPGVVLGTINVQGRAGHAMDRFPVVATLDGPTLEALAPDERWAIDQTHAIVQRAGQGGRGSLGAFGARTLAGATEMDMARPMKGYEPGVIEIVIPAQLAGG